MRSNRTASGGRHRNRRWRRRPRRLHGTAKQGWQRNQWQGVAGVSAIAAWTRSTAAPAGPEGEKDVEGKLEQVEMTRTNPEIPRPCPAIPMGARPRGGSCNRSWQSPDTETQRKRKALAPAPQPPRDSGPPGKALTTGPLDCRCASNRRRLAQHWARKAGEAQQRTAISRARRRTANGAQPRLPSEPVVP